MTAALLFLLSVFSLFFGSYPLADFFRGKGDPLSVKVFFTLRLPRVLAGVLVGGILGLTGAVCQTVFSNPLASPDITGVASGASFGAAGAILLGFTGFFRIGAAFAGGILAFFMLLLFVRLAGPSSDGERGKYLLSGILISALFEAGVMILKTLADPERELAAIEFWTMGSLASVTSEKLLWMAGASLPAITGLFLFERQARILSGGGEKALSLGVSPKLWQTVLMVLVTWAVAAAVSFVGVIGFAGLIVPHISMAVLKRRGKAFFVLSFMFGGILIVLSDLLARTVSNAEIPIGIFCVLSAVIWFLWLFIFGKRSEVLR